MKKVLFVAVIALVAVVAQAQEKPQKAEPPAEQSLAELHMIVAAQKQQIVDLQRQLLIAQQAALGADVAKRFNDAAASAYVEAQSADTALKSEKKKDENKAQK
ncbi:hypothetical protein ACOBR2_06420 [Telmatobacter bradus]|uniref:hypothetical protein n=1 Tax=Telmatobacter bradus TaxID=474953 RepID=UPI003B434EAE